MATILTTGQKLLDIPQFRVFDTDYSTPTFKFNQGKSTLALASIENLDNIILRSRPLTFELSFPFSDSKKYLLKADGDDFTIRFMIDGIREAYKNLYTNSKNPPFRWEETNDDNTEFYVIYPFEGLYIEQIFYNKKEHSLTLIVDGKPDLTDFDLPF